LGFDLTSTEFGGIDLIDMAEQRDVSEFDAPSRSPASGILRVVLVELGQGLVANGLVGASCAEGNRRKATTPHQSGMTT